MSDQSLPRHDQDTDDQVENEDKTEVGRMAGTDEGYDGVTGAEARAAGSASRSPVGEAAEAADRGPANDVASGVPRPRDGDERENS